MASVSTYPIGMLRPERVMIQGSFAPAGTGAVTAVKGKGFSVARTGVGTFVVTLANSYADLESADAHLQLAAPNGNSANVGAVNLAARTITLVTVASGAVADIAANADNRVHFAFVLRNTSIAH